MSFDTFKPEYFKMILVRSQWIKYRHMHMRASTKLGHSNNWIICIKKVSRRSTIVIRKESDITIHTQSVHI